MGLSVLVLCKDEATIIPQAIRYAQSVGDEIVVVDDVSTDGTIEVVADFAVKSLVPVVLQVRRMVDGFATQRNFGIGRCAHDWILQLDADERYSPSLAARLPELMADPNVDAYSFPTLHMVDELNHCNLDADPHVRLYRNLEWIKFDGQIHEHLTWRGNTLFAHPSHFDGFTRDHVRYCPEIWLLHYAMMKNVQEREKKVANWKSWFQRSSEAGIPVSEENIMSEYSGPRYPVPEGAVD